MFSDICDYFEPVLIMYNGILNIKICFFDTKSFAPVTCAVYSEWPCAGFIGWPDRLEDDVVGFSKWQDCVWELELWDGNSGLLDSKSHVPNAVECVTMKI